MLMKISKFNLSYLTKSCRHALSPNEKILRHIYFLSHFATMAIDSANPESSDLFNSPIHHQLSLHSWVKVTENYSCFNPLPNEKFLDTTKLKAFADNILNIAKMTTSLCDRVANTVGKEENAGNQHFLLFPQCFPKPSSVGSSKVRIVW